MQGNGLAADRDSSIESDAPGRSKCVDRIRRQRLGRWRRRTTRACAATTPTASYDAEQYYAHQGCRKKPYAHLDLLLALRHHCRTATYVAAPTDFCCRCPA